MDAMNARLAEIGIYNVDRRNWRVVGFFNGQDTHLGFLRTLKLAREERDRCKRIGVTSIRIQNMTTGKIYR